MNCAETVYAQPELEGESMDPEYQRFLPGFGITKLIQFFCRLSRKPFSRLSSAGIRIPSLLKEPPIWLAKYKIILRMPSAIQKRQRVVSCTLTGVARIAHRIVPKRIHVFMCGNRAVMIASACQISRHDFSKLLVFSFSFKYFHHVIIFHFQIGACLAFFFPFITSAAECLF